MPGGDEKKSVPVVKLPIANGEKTIANGEKTNGKVVAVAKTCNNPLNGSRGSVADEKEKKSVGIRPIIANGEKTNGDVVIENGNKPTSRSRDSLRAYAVKWDEVCNQRRTSCVDDSTQKCNDNDDASSSSSETEESSSKGAQSSIGTRKKNKLVPQKCSATDDTTSSEEESSTRDRQRSIVKREKSKLLELERKKHKLLERIRDDFSTAISRNEIKISRDTSITGRYRARKKKSKPIGLVPSSEEGCSSGL